MDIGTLFLVGIGIIVVLVILVALDWLFAGGAGTMGMMYGTTMMTLAPARSAGVSNPVGQAILLVLIAILGVLVYAVFFR